MGQEIQHSHFRKQDFERFEVRLREETELLAGFFEGQRFADDPCMGGFELEAWLIDGQGRPLPENERFLATLNNELVVPELARFNVELNGQPRALVGNALGKMQAELDNTWDRCQQAAAAQQAELLVIGILPTVRESELVLANMSAMTRYRALNEQVQRIRRGHPLKIDIEGHEHLRLYHQDVMMESAATSFQLHLQVDERHAVRAFNAAIILSAPMVAATANSPYLFGRDLWEETRIPLFEQAVAMDAENQCSMPRVTFGTGYAGDSLMDCFLENQQRYPVLLPEALEGAPEQLNHLRLHNGTIWRWNRPLVGFDAQGRPHLRIEHRVIPAGPSLVDAIANAALFFGLACELINQTPAPESQLTFAQARTNFYTATRYGLKAPLRWLQGGETDAQTLLVDELLPKAGRGLEMLDMDGADIRLYMEILEGRLQSGRTGAAWQRAWVARHGRDMGGLVAAYRDNQRSGNPAHEWTI